MDPLAVVIVTPIMQRANALRESSQIAFVDSTASCDCENHSLTFILAPCAAGAIPLGVLITASQSTADYSLAFSLFKAVTEPDAFGGKGYPLTFVTDDSEAEQCALREVWPESKTRSAVCLALAVGCQAQHPEAGPEALDALISAAGACHKCQRCQQCLRPGNWQQSVGKIPAVDTVHGIVLGTLAVVVYGLEGQHNVGP